MRKLSIITNFGCHYNCPYCNTKINHIDIPETTLDGLDNLKSVIKELKTNSGDFDSSTITISGGGDPLYNFTEHIDWWEKLFKLTPKIKKELHTSYLPFAKEQSRSMPFEFIKNDMFYKFSKYVYHCISIDDLDRLGGDVYQSKYGFGDVIVRAVFVVTKDMTEDMIMEIFNRVQDNPYIHQLSFRQLIDKGYVVRNYLQEFLINGELEGKWRYIVQNDYNYYYVNGKVFEKFKDLSKTLKIF